MVDAVLISKQSGEHTYHRVTAAPPSGDRRSPGNLITVPMPPLLPSAHDDCSRTATAERRVVI